MQDVSTSEGRTVLFVSHNLNAVRTLCRSGILLARGKVLQTGEHLRAGCLFPLCRTAK